MPLVLLTFRLYEPSPPRAKRRFFSYQSKLETRVNAPFSWVQTKSAVSFLGFVNVLMIELFSSVGTISIIYIVLY